MKAGADDYLTKPYDIDDLVERIRHRLASRAIRQLESAGVIDFALSPATEMIVEQLRRVAGTDLAVLFTGETGTGKEVAARYLHAASTRSAKPFVAVNCGAIPHELLESQFFGHERGAFTGAAQAHVGFFEETGEGTLFLDEIGELDAHLQTALLRVLQDGFFRPIRSRKDRRFAGRVVAATNANLDQLRQEKKFREDLYYRLHVVKLRIPPLRERRSDIPQTFAFFLDEAAAKMGLAGFRIDDAVRRHLVEHDWPGNVRELKNFAYSVVLDLPSDPGRAAMPADAPLAERVRRFEATIIEDTLAQTRGNIAETMARLGVPRKTLYDKMAKLGIDPKRFRG